MAIAHINIGSNLGNRQANMARAVAGIVSLSPLPHRISTILESEPWGFETPNKFLNVGISIDTSLSPTELFGRLQAIEQSISDVSHRTPSGSYADRLIDIDLICIDDLIISTPQLILPHPRMHLRDFVLKPLNELSPHWIHPILNLTPAQMLANLNNLD